MKIKSRIFISSKYLSKITLMVVVLTILSIWLFGLGKHKTIFENSILSVSILSVTFFMFLAIGLYKGLKLKEDVGKITDQLRLDKMPKVGELVPDVDLSFSDEFHSILLGILLWIVVTILIIVFFWLFSVFVWSGVIIFMAMLYWIFFRALRLVFKNGKICKGNFIKSVTHGFAYTMLYNFWIYGIILTAHYLI